MISAAGTLVLVTYLGVYLLITDETSFIGFLKYCLHHAAMDRSVWGNLEYFSSTGLFFLLDRQLWNLYVVSTRILPAVRILFFLTLALTLLWNGVWIYRQRKEGAYRVMLLAWLMTHFTFFLW